MPAEESQREYHSPNKEMNQDCVVESSSTENTSHFTGTLQPFTDTLRPVTTLDQGQQYRTNSNTTKVTRTKVTEIKLKMADNKHHSSRTSKRNTKKLTAINDTSKLHKNKKKMSVAKSETTNTKLVAMEGDKSSGEIVTLTPNEVSKQLKLHRLISDKHKSPSSSSVDVFDDGASSKTGQMTNVTSSKTDQSSSKINQKTNKISISDQPSNKISTSDQPSSKTDQKTNIISTSDQPSSAVDGPSSPDIPMRPMTTDKSIISVLVNKRELHDSKGSVVTSGKSRSANNSTVKLVIMLCIFTVNIIICLVLVLVVRQWDGRWMLLRGNHYT